MTTKVPSRMLAAGAAASNLDNGSVTTAKIADANVTPAKLANSGYELGSRNVIINGEMKIAQRGTSFAAVADGTYTMDRWSYWHSSDAAVTITQDTDVPSSTTFKKSLKLAVTTADTSIAAGQYSFLRYVVEGYDFACFVGKAATMSFWVKAYKAGTYSITFRNSGSDRSYAVEYTVNASNTWEYKTVNLTFNYSGGTWDFTNGTGLKISFALACGSTYAGATGSWASADYRGSTGQTNGLDSTSNTFFLTGVQFEIGSTATQFEVRPYGTELALCQRYFQKIDSLMGTGQATTTVTSCIEFPVEMRASPTVSLSAAAKVSDFTVQDYVQSSASVTINGGTRVSAKGAMLNFANFSGLTLYRPVGMIPSESGNLLFTAEL